MPHTTAADKPEENASTECKVLSSVMLALIFVFMVLLVNNYADDQTLDLKNAIPSNGQQLNLPVNG